MEKPVEDRTADSGQDTVVAAMLTAREAAACLDVHERTIRRAIARGELTATKRHGAFQISRNALERYRIRRPNASVSPADRAGTDTMEPLRTIAPRARLVVVGSERLAQTA
jgi:excisionase family DNA binding protein